MKLIVAADDKNGIGRNGGIPWHKVKALKPYVTDDMERFKRLTLPNQAGYVQTLLMGRKTFESIPAKFRPLVDRSNWVISSNASELEKTWDKTLAPTGRTSLSFWKDPQTAFEMAQGYYQCRVSAWNEAASGAKKLLPDQWERVVIPFERLDTTWVIGGSAIYQAALDTGLVDEIHLTRVLGDFDCDTFWPGVPEGFTRVELSRCETTEHPLYKGTVPETTKTPLWFEVWKK